MLRTSTKALLVVGIILALISAAVKADGGWSCALVLKCKGDFFTVTVTNTGPIPLTGVTITLQQGLFVGTIGFLAPGDSKTLTGNTPKRADFIGPAILSGTAGPFAAFAQSNTDQCPKDGYGGGYDGYGGGHDGYDDGYGGGHDGYDNGYGGGHDGYDDGYGGGHDGYDDGYGGGYDGYGGGHDGYGSGHDYNPPHFSTKSPHFSTRPPHFAKPPHFSTRPPHFSTRPPHFSKPPHFSTRPPHFSTKSPQFTNPPQKNAQLKVEKSCTVNVDKWGKVEVCWVAKISNKGNVPFTALTVTENQGTLLTPFAAQALPVGEDVTVKGCYTPKDQNANSFSDTVTATATTIFGDIKTAFDTATCFRPSGGGQTTTTHAPKRAHLDIFKKCEARWSNSAILVDFEIVIKNDGDEKFKSITVIDTDDRGNAPQTFIISSGLDIGATTKVKGTYKPGDQNDKKFTDKVKVVAVTWSGETKEFGPVFATCDRPQSGKGWE